ncbi:hypothetical protein SLEP1_g58476, partial [Rubroshorea leprosula]
MPEPKITPFAASGPEVIPELQMDPRHRRSGARGACRELSFGPGDELELNSGRDDDFDEAYESRQKKRNKKG